jgi:hypothetical protein
MRSGHLVPTVPQLIGASNAALGVILLATPSRVGDYVSDNDVPPIGWVRLLGARYVAQGVAQVAWPRPAVLHAAVVVDSLHALSMVALAAASPTYRRSASFSAAVAIGGATANVLAARHAQKVSR